MLTLVLGEEVGLSAQALLADGYTTTELTEAVVWTSSSPSVASVEFNTKYFNLHPTATVKALSVGTTSITAMMGALSRVLAVEVIAKPAPASLIITPGTPNDPNDPNKVST